MANTYYYHTKTSNYIVSHDYTLILVGSGSACDSLFNVLSCISAELALTAIALKWAWLSHRPMMLCIKSTMWGGRPIEAMVSILVGPSRRRRLTRLKRNMERGIAAHAESEGREEREGKDQGIRPFFSLPCARLVRVPYGLRPTPDPRTFNL